MSEHDVAKHTKEIVNVIKAPGSWRHKLGDVALEIGIIVFAITLSLLVERWREKEKERQVEHSFLVNLKKDLLTDQKQLKEDSITYTTMLKQFKYMRKVNQGQALPKDSAAWALNGLYNQVWFNASNSRYEALKASGKLDIIEDEQLQLDIVNLYQQTIPTLLSSTTLFDEWKTKVADYTDQRLIYNKQTNNIESLLRERVYANWLIRDGLIMEILERYRAVAVMNRRIVGEINKYLAEKE